jgi:hypothetical protein
MYFMEAAFACKKVGMKWLHHDRIVRRIALLRFCAFNSQICFGLVASLESHEMVVEIAAIEMTETDSFWCGFDSN